MNMNFNMVIHTSLIVLGLAVSFGWLFVDIFGEEKLDPSFAVVGLLACIIGINELNHMIIMKKLNERP